MLKELHLEQQDASFYGTRYLGRGLREKLQGLLSDEEVTEIRIDFANHGVTQSFLDEFLGVLVVSSGETLVSRLIFANCTHQTRALLNLVIGSRLNDHERLSAKNRARAHQMRTDFHAG